MVTLHLPSSTCNWQKTFGWGSCLARKPDSEVLVEKEAERSVKKFIRLWMAEHDWHSEWTCIRLLWHKGRWIWLLDLLPPSEWTRFVDPLLALPCQKVMGSNPRAVKGFFSWNLRTVDVLVQLSCCGICKLNKGETETALLLQPKIKRFDDLVTQNNSFTNNRLNKSILFYKIFS